MKKKTKQDYYNLASEHGFKWVGGVLPENVSVKTLWECKKGHRWKVPYSYIQQDNGCPYCCGQARKIIDDYYVLAKKKKFKWMGEVLPKNIHTKTLWKCSKEHLWQAEYNSINGGSGCPFCANKAPKTEKDYQGLAESRCFKWVGKVLPKNIRTKTLWECEKGHRWEAVYNNIYNGNGCPFCKNFINGAPISKPQIRLNDLLCGSLNYPEGRYRVDVAIMRRSQKIAVEYDAQYWHQGREKQDAKRDNYLILKGWKILHIKTENLLPKSKKLKTAITRLLRTNNKTYNLYLEDWK